MYDMLLLNDRDYMIDNIIWIQKLDDKKTEKEIIKISIFLHQQMTQDLKQLYLKVYYGETNEISNETIE